MEKNSAILGKRIEQCRKEAGLTQQQLADEFGVQRQIIGYYENGSRKPDIDMLSILADRFLTTTDYLLGLTDVKTVDKDIRFIREYIGLNDESIRYLHEWHLGNDSEIDFINHALRLWNASFFSLASMYKDRLEYYKKRQAVLIQRMTLDCPSVLETETMPDGLYEKYADDYFQLFQIMRDVRLSYFDATESFKKSMDRFVRLDYEESDRMEKKLTQIFVVNNPDEKSDSNNGND